MVPSQRIERLAEADKVAGDQLRTLVDELVIGVLAIGAVRSPDDWARLVIDPATVEIDVLPVALHVELLQVGAEPGQILIVGQDSDRLSTKKIVVPHAD